MNFFIYIINILMCFSLISQAIPSLDENVDTHLGQYSEYNSNHHDNIDDEPHSHTHKHSEDGEEHEHKHEHTKLTQSDSHIFNNNQKELAQTDNYKSSDNFFENSLISNPHPQGIFRPPIV